MKRIPLLYKSEEVSKDLVLTTRSDRKGNILHCVEYPDDNSPSGMSYAMFSHLSSALDFINTNFTA